MVGDELVRTIDLRKYFPAVRGLLRVKKYLKAVDGVNITVRRGEILGVVGESGCGKTTLGKLLVKLETPTSGRILFEGRDVTRLKGRALREFRRRVQMIFQNPYSSFDPRLPIRDSLEEPLRANGFPREEAYERIARMLEEVGLTPPEDFMNRYPHELSGGQLQRASIARALAIEPSFVVADEPTSMLDASLRAGILNLLLKMRDAHGVSFLFITHDIAAARYVCDRMVVMYLGKVVEEGPADEVVESPQHPYTQALISSVPVADPEAEDVEVNIRGEPRPAIDVSGCRFKERCPYYSERCEEEPQLVEVRPGHYVACHLYARR